MNATMIFKRSSHSAVLAKLVKSLVDRQLRRDLGLSLSEREPLSGAGGVAAEMNLCKQRGAGAGFLRSIFGGA